MSKPLAFEIKVGDNLYLHKFGRLYSVEPVIRITKTMVITEHFRFKHPSGTTNFLDLVGGYDWNSVSARAETPQLKAEGRELMLTDWMQKNWRQIPLDEIESLKAKMEKKS